MPSKRLATDNSLAAGSPKDDVSAVSRGEQAWQKLREAIFAGRFPPGGPLRFHDLQDLCEMSVSPVREALTRLVTEGLVEAEHNRGYRVAALSRNDLDDLVRTRIRVEGFALERAIALGDEHWEAHIISTLHVLARLPRRRPEAPKLMDDEWERRHADFHAALIAACNSPITLQFCKTLYHRADRYRRFSLAVETGPRDVGAEHEAIAKATLARDNAAAQRALATHYSNMAKFIRPTI